MGGRRKKILLVNPWIYDFAAYDLWARPLGLLRLGARLRSLGQEVFLIDCLDVYSPWAVWEEAGKPRRKAYQCGKFFREPVDKPMTLTSIPRTYSRYGMKEGDFWRALQGVGRPDAVLVTSSMTYWYPGPLGAIVRVKEAFPGTPVVLGGVYATLCGEHARATSKADYVYEGGGVDGVLALLEDILEIRLDLGSEEVVHPAFDLYPHLGAVCVASSSGCPYRCPYCASGVLEGSFRQRRPGEVVDELVHWVEEYHVTDIAFYDDALLVNPADHFIPIFEEIAARGIECRFHTPNGVHARALTWEIAELMFRAGFRTIRLGLETIDRVKQVEMGSKADDDDVRGAIELLKEAGYSRREIGVYLMAGLPGQPWEEVEEGVERVWEWGALPKIAEYSPIPHTGLWEEACRSSPFDLEGEPLFQNNSILPCRWEGFSWEDLAGIKARLRDRLCKDVA